MKLYFIRHATASDVAPSDAERELTKEGCEESRIAGAALAKFGVAPDHILTSPLTRARQTAALIASELKFKQNLTVCEELCNSCATTQLLQPIKSFTGAKELLLVGHMPSLAEHLSALLGAGNADAFSMGKGSIACLEILDLRPGLAELRWFLRQKQLRLLA